jgi:hypothetical protein
MHVVSTPNIAQLAFHNRAAPRNAQNAHQAEPETRKTAAGNDIKDQQPQYCGMQQNRIADD